VEGVVVDPQAWAGRRVLVTGHTGFKGSWLTLWLTSLGASVTGLSTAPPTAPSLFELAAVGDDLAASLDVDVRAAGAVADAVEAARPQTLFHLAAQPLVGLSYDEPVATWQTNVIGTANVLEAARTAGAEVESIVVVTSDKCYLNPEDDRAFVETDALGGHDPYSASKAGAELVAAAYRESYDMPVATARAGNVIGGGDFAANRLVPDAARALAAGESLRLRHPDFIRPWQHVLCPLHGYLVLAERRAAGAWNFGPAEADSRPVAAIADALGVPWEHDGHDFPHEAHYLRLDSAKARAELGWEPRWDLERGLAATGEWYAAHRDGGDLRALTLSQIADYAA
jgi:CDP-glucose 4,6-dehydratase